MTLMSYTVPLGQRDTWNAQWGDPDNVARWSIENYITKSLNADLAVPINSQMNHI